MRKEAILMAATANQLPASLQRSSWVSIPVWLAMLGVRLSLPGSSLRQRSGCSVLPQLLGNLLDHLVDFCQQPFMGRRGVQALVPDLGDGKALDLNQWVEDLQRGMLGDAQRRQLPDHADHASLRDDYVGQQKVRHRQGGGAVLTPTPNCPISKRNKTSTDYSSQGIWLGQ
ncbi:hypothetical protein ACXPVS_22550 [Pseudomonas sp. Ma2-10]